MKLTQIQKMNLSKHVVPALEASEEKTRGCAVTVTEAELPLRLPTPLKARPNLMKIFNLRDPPVGSIAPASPGSTKSTMKWKWSL